MVEALQTEQNSQKDWSKHQFVKPTKQITTMQDVEDFKKSQCFTKLMQFTYECQKAITSKDRTSSKFSSKFEVLQAFLTKIEVLIEKIPPLKSPMRFGNKAFKTWLDAVRMVKIISEQFNFEKELPSFFEKLLPQQFQKQPNEDKILAADELSVYLIDSFGSYERIDYGTGHELNFFFFLICLRDLGLFDSSDYESLILHIFSQYIKLMRKLQLTYMLEPAGSRGVWALDDYHFLPFLLGAAQLIDHKVIVTPDFIHKDEIIQKYSDDFLYLECIKFIKEVKKGTPFFECSPILNDISASVSWKKVAMGFLKMYQAEVLFKFPVVQHCYFGSLLILK